MDEQERKEAIAQLSGDLQKIANDNNVLVLSFIAPDKGVRVSPIGSISAALDIEDIYEIEKVVESLENDGPLPKTLHLIIQTPGGYVHVATKISKYLRDTFENIHAFVPYEASSGGTVLCLAANQITMGKMANLTPIDPQTIYKGNSVSVTSYQQAVNDFKKSFGTMTPEEIPPPYRQLVEKLDPIILQEMNKVYLDSMLVAVDLLEASYKPQNDDDMEQIMRTARSLTFSPRNHNHLINAKEASNLGLRIDDTVKNKNLLKIYKNWVSLILREEKSSHVIHHFKPKKKANNKKSVSRKKS